MSDSETSDDWAAAMEEQKHTDGGADADWDAAMAEQDNVTGQNTEVSKPKLESLEEEDQGRTIEDASLDVILDIPVNISMEVGQTKISIRNLLKLNQGSVVELDRLAGEPLDVLVNGTLIAHAEVVVVNEKYGIRLTDIISASERIQKLK
jgi:flagellar motor switch protein FliN